LDFDSTGGSLGALIVGSAEKVGMAFGTLAMVTLAALVDSVATPVPTVILGLVGPAVASVEASVGPDDEAEEVIVDGRVVLIGLSAGILMRIPTMDDSFAPE